MLNYNLFTIVFISLSIIAILSQSGFRRQDTNDVPPLPHLNDCPTLRNCSIESLRVFPYFESRVNEIIFLFEYFSKFSANFTEKMDKKQEYIEWLQTSTLQEIAEMKNELDDLIAVAEELKIKAETIKEVFDDYVEDIGDEETESLYFWNLYEDVIDIDPRNSESCVSDSIYAGRELLFCEFSYPLYLRSGDATGVAFGDNGKIVSRVHTTVTGHFPFNDCQVNYYNIYKDEVEDVNTLFYQNELNVVFKNQDGYYFFTYVETFTERLVVKYRPDVMYGDAT